MAGPYTVRLPDATEYGPADLDTLRAWNDEGRLPPGSVVRTEGSAWVTLDEALAPRPATAAPPKAKTPAPPRPAATPAPKPVPVTAAPAAPHPAPAAPHSTPAA